MNPGLRTRVWGVDFSADQGDAGRGIWLAEGELDARGVAITACRPLDEVRPGSRKRDAAMPALCDVIGRAGEVAVGLDFPFGMPASLVVDATWEAFLGFFPSRFPTADRFREACRRGTPGEERTRKTDELAQTPFSPYNLRLYKQTWCGIARVLHPLVRDSRVRVVPMQKPEPGWPVLLEICPASTLGPRGARTPYKGKSARERGARTSILDEYEARGELTLASPALRTRAVEDREGDALDAILAAVATARAVRSGFGFLAPRPAEAALEGWIYA